MEPESHRSRVSRQSVSITLIDCTLTDADVKRLREILSNGATIEVQP